MSGFLKRAAAVTLGIVLGMAVVAGTGLWHARPLKRDPVPTPPPPIQREPAPDPQASAVHPDPSTA